MLDPHVGLINILSISPIPITIGRDRAVDLNSRHLFPFHENHPFRLAGPSPAVVPMARFLEKWDVFTSGILGDLDWTNVVVAGGAVAACLAPTGLQDMTNMELMGMYQSDIYSGSDIDLFLYGLSHEQAIDKMRAIEDQVRARAYFPTICVRRSHTISIHTTFPARPVQIVLRLYHSPAEILAGFDIDAVCCAFDGTHVWMNPRSLSAFVRHANTVDMTRRSASYEVRLAKYAHRGFEVLFSDLRRDEIDLESEVFDPQRSTFPSGLARLLILEQMNMSPESYPNLTYPLGYRARMNINDHIMEPPPLGEVDLAVVHLAPSDYDFFWRALPYGRGWDAQRIKSLSDRLDNKLNYVRRMNSQRRLHYHVIYAGTMDSCLGRFCRTCPVPETDEEREVVEQESGCCIYGSVRFLETNPGQQSMIGSFNPINFGDWAAEAYQRRTHPAPA
ncbi:hypothetical protein M413DRAFT_31553 [Hebeloma cylindrosporum]|uniref:Uncharacterized protein n=1 Tax=Hebeloma cylindrosporum TaxID=76867 RepID=A0A0C3BWP2_HEBCY|nr:hypothetical protein M413DRAFT_31553 [Hebeloma cylindrosporum h7]